MSEIVLTEGAAPAASASKRKIYAKTDGVYELSGTGTETKLANTPDFTTGVHFSKGTDLTITTNTITLTNTGNYFRILGSGSLNSIANITPAPPPGTWVRFEFTIITTLANSATFILPKSTNIITAVGDIFDFVETAAGTWTCTGSSQHNLASTLTAAGIVELATAAETTTGTDAVRAVHPAGLKVELDKKAKITQTQIDNTTTPITVVAANADSLLTNKLAAISITFNLPTIDASILGKTFRFAKFADQTVIIQAAAGEVIADSAATGTVTNNTAGETFANITLEAAAQTMSVNIWIINAAHGTWATA